MIAARYARLFVAMCASTGAARLSDRSRSHANTTPAPVVTATVPTTAPTVAAPLSPFAPLIGRHEVPEPEHDRAHDDRATLGVRAQQHAEEHTAEDRLLEERRAERDDHQHHEHLVGRGRGGDVTHARTTNV